MAPSDMVLDSALITLNGVDYTIATEGRSPSGRRAYTRRTRPTNANDPGRLRTASWKLSGPIGLSREDDFGRLGHDFSQNLETRFDSLLTSAVKLTGVTLTGSDPGDGSSGNFGSPKFGAAGVKFGTTRSGASVDQFTEDRGYVFVRRGAISTQVNSSWSVVDSTSFDGLTSGEDIWFNKGYIGLGESVPLQRRLTINVSAGNEPGARYEDVQVSGANIYARSVRATSDRFWLIRADSTVSNDNQARFTLDDFSSISNSFTVGPPGEQATGIGSLAAHTFFGGERGIYSFLATGAPKPVTHALKGHKSKNNGRQLEEQWGWAYGISDLTLYAFTDRQANPVGVGSDLMLKFEGFGGRPTAVFPWRESLLVAYEDDDSGNVHVLQGLFGTRTGATGQPDLYPYAYLTSTTVNALGATSVATNPANLIANGTNMYYALRGRGANDTTDTNYVYGVGGGSWFGSTLMRQQDTLKNVRFGTFTTENMVSGDSWTLAVSLDGGSYVNVGSAVAANGFNQVFPLTGSTPLTTVNGRTIKPRLTQVAGGSGSSAAPPQIRGTLTLSYDERPELIDEITVTVLPGEDSTRRQTAIDALVTLAGDGTASPTTIRLPDEDTDVHGYVIGSELTDMDGDGVMGQTLVIHLWEVS